MTFKAQSKACEWGKLTSSPRYRPDLRLEQWDESGLIAWLLGKDFIPFKWTNSKKFYCRPITAFRRGEADIKVDPRIAIAQLHDPKSCPCSTSWIWACSTAFSSTSMLMTSAWSDLASFASSNSCSHSAWYSLKLLYDFLSSSFILWTFAWRSLLSNSRPSNNSVNSSITSSTALSWWSFYPTDLVRWVMRSLAVLLSSGIIRILRATRWTKLATTSCLSLAEIPDERTREETWGLGSCLKTRDYQQHEAGPLMSICLSSIEFVGIRT